jgi:hypothetical protein
MMFNREQNESIWIISQDRLILIGCNFCADVVSREASKLSIILFSNSRVKRYLGVVGAAHKKNSQNRTFFPFYQVINPLVHFSVCLKDVVKCCPKSAG